jgi:hypothetical protein
MKHNILLNFVSHREMFLLYIASKSFIIETMTYSTLFSMLYLMSKYNLFRRFSINILQDIQNFPNHCNKHLNPQRKFWSADSTGYINLNGTYIFVSGDTLNV